MNQWMDLLLAALFVPSFVILGSSRLPSCLGALVWQGLLLGILPLVSLTHAPTMRVLMLAAAVILIKGVALPRLLGRAMRQADVRHEVEPIIGYGLSILVGILGLIASFWLSSRLPLPGSLKPSLAVALAFFNVFAGFILLVSRRKALTQVIGYLVLESGVYIFGVAIALELPVLVELGILLDVFVGVFVMGIMIFHIQRTFDHIDTDRLSVLKE
jgi:hydrogenase-4 component E